MSAVIYPSSRHSLIVQINFTDALIDVIFTNLPPGGRSRLSCDLLAEFEVLPC